LSFFTACEEGPNFRIIEYPDFSVTGISKTEGYPTTNVTITGSGFGDLKGAVKVFFGGVQATNIVSVSDTEIVVTVPANAVSGVVNVKVWTNTHDLNENFAVIPSPTITSVSSDAGSPGDQITIVGTGFVGLSNMSISFNGTTGTINSVNPEGTTIVATVPNGFTSGPIVLSIFDYRLTGPGFAYLVPVPRATYQLDFENNLNETFGGTAATYTQGLGSPLAYITGINPGTKGIYLAGYSNASGGTNQNIFNQVLALPANVGKYNELTVACWVQYLTADRTNWTPIWEFGQTRGNKIALYGQTSRSGANMEGRIFFENVTGFTGYNETWYATTKGIPSTGWHHLAMTLSKADLKMTVYLDGLAVGSKALPALYDLNLYNQTRAYIGTQAYGNANETAIKASYDKFQIFNSALSADQIYTLFYKK
jgi:hypothetical protein